MRVVNSYLLVGARWGATARNTTVVNFTKTNALMGGREISVTIAFRENKSTDLGAKSASKMGSPLLEPINIGEAESADTRAMDF